MIIKTIALTKEVKNPDNEPLKILENISLTIPENDFTVILGPSGSGKTTLLQILGLMDSFTEGTMEIFGQDTETFSHNQKALLRSSKIGFVFQKSLLIKDLTVEENLILLNKIANKTPDKEKIYTLLETVGIFDKKNYYPQMLSAGQAQRASLARAVINDPSIIIADEPTANLDKDNKIIILNLLKSFNENNSINILLASHDDIVLDYSSMVIKLADGKLVET